MLNKMNLPNKLTMLRIVLVPFFIVFMAIPNTRYIALMLYIVASITDALDGHIARKYNQITTFGKIMDPLADKLLVSSGFIMLTYVGIIPGFITATIIFRDLSVSSLRMFAVENKKANEVGAVLSGKIKTIFQLVGIIFGIFALSKKYQCINFFEFINSKNLNFGSIERIINTIFSVSIAIAFVTTIWSLIDYFLKYKKYIDVTK